MLGNKEATVGSLTPDFLLHAQVELAFSPETIIKYRDCLRQVVKHLGDIALSEFSKAHVTALKSEMLRRTLGVNRQVTILHTLKRFLRYAREECGVATYDPEQIQVPSPKRPEVAYLTSDEVSRFVESITIRGKAGQWYMAGLRFRVLVETILGSAMRISEVLSLNRSDIDFETAEARIVGKGRKPRTAFFTDRALFWLRTLLAARSDDNKAIFVTQDLQSRLKRPDVWRPFKRYTARAGLRKRVTPHLLRHTAATQLLFNGCPIGHIQVVLGHEHLETTCRFYLGRDLRAAKAAHRQYLVYSSDAQH
jgi:site-specific recombinase XerD